MTATRKCKDYTAFSEKELLKMLGANERQENKLKAQLDTIAQERHFIKDAIMQKWREPSDELLEAIAEFERGDVIHCENFDEYLKAINEFED